MSLEASRGEIKNSDMLYKVAENRGILHKIDVESPFCK